MARIIVGAIILSMGISHAHAFDCPNTGDTCVVGPQQERVDLEEVGIYTDDLVLGTLQWGSINTLAACVNGIVRFSTADNALERPQLTKDTVICVGGGNDTVYVLGNGEVSTCQFFGFQVQLTAFRYNNYELAIFGQGGNDNITGAQGYDQLCGGSGNDKLAGRSGINELNGGAGNDDLLGGTDIDYLFGAEGDDYIVDQGTGGFRRACYTGGQAVTPSRIEGGGGNDCLQLPRDTEPYWCYKQEEACGTGAPEICHGGVFCATGYDRIDTNGTYGGACEVRTTNVACRR